MKSVPTPYTHKGRTSEELKIEFGPGRIKSVVTVPAGQRCILLEGPGARWVVDDLSFMDRKSMDYHDADHYGIPVPVEKIVDIESMKHQQDAELPAPSFS